MDQAGDWQNSWVEVDTGALRHNFAALRAVLARPKAPLICAVVKANGYGHGLSLAAGAFVEAGADFLAVTHLSEAQSLAASGFDFLKIPTLVFAPPASPAQSRALVSLGAAVTVCDRHSAGIVASAALEALGRDVDVHLKVDTGMGRFGVAPADAPALAKWLAEQPNLRLAGCYTHFPKAGDRDSAQTLASLKTFEAACDAVRPYLAKNALVHCANSAAALRFPACRHDMVRLGTVLYGQYPSEQVPRVPGLNAGTFALKARVLAVRDLPAGATVGYGSERTVTRQTRALVVGIGFADGFGMSPDSMYRGRRGVKRLIAQCFGVSPHVRIDGVDLAVLGRVAMQTIVVDAAPMKREVQVGDVVDVPVRRLAVGAHVPRIEKPA